MSNFQARNCRHVLGATHQNKRPTCFLITMISFCLDEIHPFLLYPGCCYFVGLDLHISLSKEDTAIPLESPFCQEQVHLRKNASVFLRWHKWVNAYCVWQATLEFGIDNQPQFPAGIWRTLFTPLPWLPHLGPCTSFHVGSFTPSSTSKSKLLKQNIQLEAHVYYCNYTLLDADYISQCKHIIIVGVLQKREKEGYDTANLLWQ
jgi:hypothetical protein